MQEKHRMALLKACHLVGGQKQLAEKIKVHPSRLNKWINRHKGCLPFHYALEIENATSGQVACHELSPTWEKVVEHCKRNEGEGTSFSKAICSESTIADAIQKNKNTLDSLQDQKEGKNK